MKKISVSLGEDHVYELKARERLDDADSRSAALRQILDEYENLRTEYEALEAECEQLRTERDDLRTRLESREGRVDELEEQLARRSQVEEKVDTLAKRVDESDEPAPPWPIRWYRYFRGDE